MTVFEHLSDKFDFGKYKGRTLGDVMTYNPEYLNWVVANVSEDICWLSDTVVEEIRKIFPTFIITEEFMNYCDQKYWAEEEDCWYEEDDDDCYSRPTYGRYGGSYAQDVMGYSDDDIDEIFDGDPDAYWNID